MNYKKLYLFLFLSLFTLLLRGQVEEYEYKAAYIERFTRFVEWPEAIESLKFNGIFKIAIIGRSPFNESLDDLFSNVKIRNQKVELIYTNDINDLIDANLVFVSSSEKRNIKDILAAINNRPILVISDTKGFGEKGCHINMYVDIDKIKIEINLEEIEKSNLKASSLLLSSFLIVRTNG